MATGAADALLSHRGLLSRLARPVPIDPSDVFWRQLTTFPLPLACLDPLEVEAFLAPFAEDLAINNGGTRNLQKLLLRAAVALTGARGGRDDPLRAANALHLVRVILKGLLERLPGHEVVSLLEEPSDGVVDASAIDPDPSHPLFQFAGALLNTLAMGDSGGGYLLQLEVVRALLVGCSSQLYVPTAGGPSGSHPILDYLMLRGDCASTVVQTVLDWLVKREPSPRDVVLFKREANGKGGMLKYVRNAAAAAIGGVMWLPSLAYQMFVRSGADVTESPLADEAQLLLLVLIYHPTGPAPNPYKHALSKLQDMAFLGGNEVSGARQAGVGAVATLSYGSLYEAISRNLADERTILLLYSLLLLCRTFQDYVLVRSDLDTLLLPILRQTYLSSSKSQSQLYLLIIIILILSQDASFGENIHKVPISPPDWYRDRAMGKTTLGSLLIVVLLRTASHNLAKTRDPYLHTNTVAALSNLATSVTALSTHAAQRLVSLLDMLFRKYDKAVRLVGGSSGGFVSGGEHSPELQFYGEFLRTLLEVINSIITTGLANNTELVYAMLYRQSVFVALQRHSQCLDLLENIQVVIEYFNTRIDEARSLQPSTDWGADKVLDVLRTTSRSWRPEKLRHFPELKFLYEEEANPEEFFVPLVWSLVVTHLDVAWNPDLIVLFSPKTPTCSVQGSEDMSVSLETPLCTPQHTSSLNGIREIEENL
ncbi:unnamed protein product [Ostreobium quekettii]|uniref:Dymeclin n=1 Tax=Ostreobium quekettii TaxID=121088 RepID=A0A8S1INV5_9CHLO|nr:unnamed protein product [Ostreobium quekettii]